ncbi:unnamed protein product [Periconia digitata]|uniref:Bacteriophage T5 Orf172 DNA-binding domain-containing protein n=1 Tax=Periconia digitata TaxID=1303443 RepID=A0A9W4XZG7_9PLEO|nr:unnamed protein product [Periconia digitata]
MPSVAQQLGCLLSRIASCTPLSFLSYVHAMSTIDGKDFVTTVTLRINFKDLTFKDSFKRERTISRTYKPRCSCSRLRDIHPYHGVRDIAQGLKPSDTVTARFVMSTPKNIKQAERLCERDANLRFEHPKEFKFWILSLAFLLSELCQSDHSSKAHEKPPIYGLRPFKEGGVSRKNVCEEIRQLLMSPLKSSEKKEHGMGYVYILRSQLGASTIGELKIGFSKYHPEHRAHEIASCYALPEVIGHTPYLPHAKRLESIIHVELQEIRKIHTCRRCKGNHQEWFTLLHRDSREIVTRWGRWILQQPYVNGELNEEWKNYLATKDFGSIDDNTSLANLWQSIIDEFPRKSLPGTESTRIADYLNQCHWDNMCTRMGVDDLENIGCDKCKEPASKLREFKKYPFANSGDGIGKLTQRLSHMGLWKEEGRGHGSCDCYRNSDLDSEPLPRDTGQKISLDQPIGTWMDRSTRLGRMFHPAIPTSYVMSSNRSFGPLSELIQIQGENEKLAEEELLNYLSSIESVKTGARSVSDAQLGITESPLGDATLLPVLALKDLKSAHESVVNWVGYTPTHSGFQFLQEAYREGKWFGRKPQFKLPKAYRAAGVDSIPMPDRSGGVYSDKFRQDTSESIRSSIPTDKRNRQEPDQTFSLSRGSEYGEDTFTFSRTMDDKFKDELQQMEQICKVPLGRAMVERETIRSFRHYGLDACFGLPDIGEESDTDEEVSSSGRSFNSTLPPVTPAKRVAESSPHELKITQKKAKRWLDSL